VLPELFPALIRRRLTSLFPADFIKDIARERDVVQRNRTIDIMMLVWTLITGFAVDREARTIAGFQRAYSAATNQTVARSSFYDRFTLALAALLSALLEHAVGECSKRIKILWMQVRCRQREEFLTRVAK
jgi:hypothetical protein